jgi:hypothetical protein
MGAALLLLSVPCTARTLVVVLLPGTSLTDWQRADAPNLHEVMATGAMAVMNTRTARLPNDRVRETPESAVLTLGAGARAAGGIEATNFQRTDARVPGVGVTAGQLYTRRMGLPVPAGARVNDEWPRLLHENGGREYDLHLGNLADALQRHGVGVKAFGGPLAGIVAADGAGEDCPPALNSRGDRCVVWDAGDDVAAADRKLEALLAHLGEGRLIVLSPCAGDAAYARGERLCPVVVWGADVAPGLIYSPSTRRTGLATNTDFAPTVAGYFGVGLTAFPSRPFGNVWEYRPSNVGVAQAAAIASESVRQWRGMKALPYLAVLLGLWMMCVTVFSFWRPVSAWAGFLPGILILSLLVSDSGVSLVLWLLALALIVVAWKWLGAARLALGLTAIMVAALIGDMLLSDPLMRLGLLGSSAIEGARYYGIGNEAMGPLVGASLVVADGVCQRIASRHQYFVWAGLGLVTALVGSPVMGAKAGGLIVALAAFGSFGWLRSGRHWDWLAAGLAAVGIAGLLILVAVLDAHLGAGHQSHLGQAVARLGAGGAGEWRDIIARKLAVEGRLLYHSAWACPLWGGLACLLWLTRQRHSENKPFLVAGLIAVGTCLAVNDAGTVAAAMCLSLLWGWVMAGMTKKPAA